MDTKINTNELGSWAASLYQLNTDAISNLTEFKNLVNSIRTAYECDSSEAIITNMNSDLDKAINSHTNMANLKGYLDSVVETAESF